MIFRFPNNPERKKQWVINIHREDGWSPSNTAVICSDHFLEKYVHRTGSRVRLNIDAIPTRFKAFPKHLKKVIFNAFIKCYLWC